MSWDDTTLGECADLISGPAFKSARFTNDPDDVPLVKGENVQQGVVAWSVSKRWPRADSSIYERFALTPGDIVVAMDRPWVPAGLKWAPITANDPPSLLVQRVARLRALPDVEPSFLRYVVASADFTAYVKNLMGGTNVPHISGGQIRAFRFRMPSRPVQEKIGSALLAYDDLIENNRRRIQLLEQSARLLYREWFVHLRFPGHEHVRAVDCVPEGWKRLTMADVAETIGGGTPSTSVASYWENGTVTWFTPSDLTGNDCLALLESDKGISEDGLKNSSAKMLPPETILMSSRASIGFFGVHDKPCCTNQGFISLIPRDERYRYFLLYNLMHRKDEIVSRAGGTTYKEINKSTFRALPIVLPDAALADEFTEFSADVMRQVRVLKRQIARLQKARDLLLPRLMSGEIGV